MIELRFILPVDWVGNKVATAEDDGQRVIVLFWKESLNTHIYNGNTGDLSRYVSTLKKQLRGLGSLWLPFMLYLLICFWDSVLCFLGWPWTHYVAEDDLELLVFLSISWVWGLQACATIPSWCGAGDMSQGFVFARQALHHQLSCPLRLQLAFSTGLLVIETGEKPAKSTCRELEGVRFPALHQASHNLKRAPKGSDVIFWPLRVALVCTTHTQAQT